MMNMVVKIVVKIFLLRPYRVGVGEGVEEQSQK